MNTDTSSQDPIRTLDVEDTKRATLTLTLAFAADPMVRWTWPDADRYLANMPGLIEAFGGAAFDAGGALGGGGLAAVALWLPPGIEPDATRLVEIVESTAPAAVRAEALGIFEKMDEYHPDEPHWYLPLIGVDPAQQGRGLGDALMRHATARIDREGAVAYLEATTPRSVPLYQRHGFESLGTIQIASSPPLVPMLRRPRMQIR